jgi:hypothetical protein
VKKHVTTKETQEALHAIAVVMARYVESRADGKVTFRENIGFVWDTPEIIKAMRGIKNVPAELEDLDTNERVVLSGDVRMVLRAAGVNHRNSDIAEWILECAYDYIRSTALLIHRIKTAPPSAITA